MIGAEVIHRYFTVLCNSVVHVNVHHLDPAFTTVIAGLEVNPTVQPHRRFTDTHLFCDWLLCPIVYNMHISYVTINYLDHSMRHEDSLCGIHVSDNIFDGLETFLRDHIALRRDHNLPIRNDLREETVWTRIPSSATPTSRQKDGVSCGILTCGNATCRVYNMPGFPFGQSYVPQMRLHMYHCILQDTFYPISLTIADENINERMSATAIWYSGHQTRYDNMLALRASRPLPPVISYAGQGTAEVPFDL
jgi:hypothetical protein